MVTLGREALEASKSVLQAGWKADSRVLEALQKGEMHLQPVELSLLCQGFSAIPEDSNVTFLFTLACLHKDMIKINPQP